MGSPKTPTFVDDSGAEKDVDSILESSIVTMEPYKINQEILNSSILHVKHIPLNWSFDVIYGELSKFGTVKEIRNKLGEKMNPLIPGSYLAVPKMLSKR